MIAASNEKNTEEWNLFSSKIENELDYNVFMWSFVCSCRAKKTMEKIQECTKISSSINLKESLELENKIKLKLCFLNQFADFVYSIV